MLNDIQITSLHFHTCSQEAALSLLAMKGVYRDTSQGYRTNSFALLLFLTIQTPS